MDNLSDMTDGELVARQHKLLGKVGALEAQVKVIESILLRRQVAEKAANIIAYHQSSKQINRGSVDVTRLKGGH